MKVDWWLVTPVILLSILGAIITRSIAPDLLFFRLAFMVPPLPL